VSYPQPVPGLVIRYSYLWLNEHIQGRDEGVKDRPCAIVLIANTEAGRQTVVVLPITHTPPEKAELAVEISAAVKRRLDLDGKRSWVILSEANRFVWPGPDLRPAIRGDAHSVVFGLLPYKLFENIKDRFDGAVRKRLARVVQRSE
jgi:phenylpyruvate tautomerase PptA (4-oxalocrotonate tautomerase family)